MRPQQFQQSQQKKKPNKIKQTPSPEKEPKKSWKNAKQCEKKQQENSPQVAIKRQWEIGPEIVRLQMPEMRSPRWWAAELPNCWRWKELQKDVSRWNWRQRRPKRNVQLNKNQSGLRYQRRFSVGVPRVPPYPSSSHASTDVAAAVASAALPIFDCDCDCQQVALTAPQTFA